MCTNDRKHLERLEYVIQSRTGCKGIIIVANDGKTQQQKATATLCLSTVQTRNAILGSTMRPVKTGAMCGCASGDAGSSVRDVASEHEAPSSSIFNISGRGNRTAHKHAQTNTARMHALGRTLPAWIRTPAGGRLTSAHPRHRVLWPGRRSHSRPLGHKPAGRSRKGIGIKQIPGPRVVPGPPM